MDFIAAATIFLLWLSLLSLLHACFVLDLHTAAFCLCALAFIADVFYLNVYCIEFVVFIVNFTFFFSFLDHLHPKSSMSQWMLLSMNKSSISPLLIFIGALNDER